MAYINKKDGFPFGDDYLCASCSNCKGLVRGQFKYCPWCGEKFEQLTDAEIEKLEIERLEKSEADERQRRKEQLWKDFMNETTEK